MKVQADDVLQRMLLVGLLLRREPSAAAFMSTLLSLEGIDVLPMCAVTV